MVLISHSVLPEQTLTGEKCTSRITHIIERQIGTVTLADSFLDGFRGNITDMKESEKTAKSLR